MSTREADERSPRAAPSLPTRLIPLVFALITALFGASVALFAPLAEAESQRGDETETLEVASNEFDAAADVGPPVPVLEARDYRAVGPFPIDLPVEALDQSRSLDEQRDQSRLRLGSLSLRGPPTRG